MHRVAASNLQVKYDEPAPLVVHTRYTEEVCKWIVRVAMQDCNEDVVPLGISGQKLREARLGHLPTRRPRHERG